MGNYASCPSPSPSPSCSGHGTLQTNGLCICDPYWTGAADLFDLRISPTEQTLDCPLSVIGIYVAWSIVLLVVILRAFQLAKALQVVHNRHQANSIGAAMKLMTYRVLILELFGTTPNFLALAILKLAYQSVIGTDVAVTVCLANTVIFYLIANSDLELREFQVMTRASMRSEQLRKRMIIVHRRFVLAGAASYFLLGLAPTYAILGTDKTQGPTCNGTLPLMLVRFIGVCIWQTFSLISKIQVRNRMHEAVASTRPENNEQQQQQQQQNADIHTKEHSKAHDVVAELEIEVQKNVKQCAIACTLYTIFLLPWLWTQETYIIAVVTTIGCLRHPGKHLMREDRSGDNNNNMKDKSSARITSFVSGQGE
jgi:hypothetical protein